MPLHYVDTDVLRAACKRNLENLEQWLRRLIDGELSKVQHEYLKIERNGSPIFKSSIREGLVQKSLNNPNRFPRPIDAATLEQEIAIITNQMIYNDCFGAALSAAFPNGRDECRVFLSRLIEPRNHLYHANHISIRQAERVCCYSNDVIDSLKDYYMLVGLDQEYNAPTIIAYRDSLGRSFSGTGLRRDASGEKSLWDTTGTSMIPWPKFRVGDTATFEVDIDPSFDSSDYKVLWQSLGSTWGEGRRLEKTFQNADVMQHQVLLCRVISNKEWHRLGGSDDVLYVHMSVLPSL